jgi:uncharacterized membrane protein
MNHVIRFLTTSYKYIKLILQNLNNWVWVAIILSIFSIIQFKAGGNQLVTVVVGLSCFCAGFLMGFLFAIPKVVAEVDREGTDKDSQSSHQYQINSSLMDISDWLTKIIVGVGLVEFGSISQKLWQASLEFKA